MKPIYRLFINGREDRIFHSPILAFGKAWLMSFLPGVCEIEVFKQDAREYIFEV